VTAHLKLHNVEEATEHKHRIEQRQRDDVKRRTETGETWDTRVTMLQQPWHYIEIPNVAVNLQMSVVMEHLQ